MKPFIALGEPSRTVLARGLDYRPLGAVVGVSVVGNVAVSTYGLDGAEVRYRAESFGLALAGARRRAVEQAASLGASGVIGVRIESRNMGKPGDSGSMVEVRCVGTAVFRDAAAERPFLASLDGPGLAALAAAGYRPVGLVVGYAFFAQIPGYRTTNAIQAARGTWGNGPYEHPDYTRAIAQSRQLALSRLEADAREAGGEGIIGVEFRPEIVKRESGMRIDVVTVGTAVVRDRRASTAAPEPAMVIPISR